MPCRGEQRFIRCCRMERNGWEHVDSTFLVDVVFFTAVFLAGLAAGLVVFFAGAFFTGAFVSPSAAGFFAAFAFFTAGFLLGVFLAGFFFGAAFCVFMRYRRVRG